MSLSQLCPISPDYPGFTYFTQVWLCAVRQSVRHFLGRAYLSQNIIAGSRRGERGKCVRFKGTEGEKHLRSSGKGPQKWETGGAEPPGPEYRLSPLLGRRPRKTKVGVQLVRFIHHKTRDSKEPAKTKIVGPNLEIWQKIPSRSGMKKSNKIS